MQNKYALPGLLTHYSRLEPHFDLMGHCSAKVMPNSDPEGKNFLSTPNSHGRFFSLHTLSVFIALCHFKYETFTNILTETQSIFCSCGYNYIINLVPQLQLHVYIIGRVAIS